MVKENGVGGAVAVAQDTLELFSRLEGLEPNDGDLVIGSDLVVVGLVGECKRKHALLLQVGLVDSATEIQSVIKSMKSQEYETIQFLRFQIKYTHGYNHKIIPPEVLSSLLI